MISLSPYRWRKNLLVLCFVSVLVRLGVLWVSHYKSTSVLAAQSSLRVLCWVLTSPKTKLRAELIKKTWGKRCDKLLFMSSHYDKTLPTVVLPVNDTWWTLWGKTQEALHYLYEHHLEDADWFYKADDDTYLVMENLKHYLRPLDHSLPFYLGSRRKNENTLQGYIEGGAGYVMTKSSISLFVEYAYKSQFAMCTPGHEGPEDINLGECMERLGALFGDSRDPQRRERFLQFSLDEYYYGNHWLNQNSSFYPQKTGKDCCSNLTISLHKTTDQHLLEYEFLTYKFRKP